MIFIYEAFTAQRVEFSEAMRVYHKIIFLLPILIVKMYGGNIFMF